MMRNMVGKWPWWPDGECKGYREWIENEGQLMYFRTFQMGNFGLVYFRTSNPFRLALERGPRLKVRFQQVGPCLR